MESIFVHMSSRMLLPSKLWIFIICNFWRFRAWDNIYPMRGVNTVNNKKLGVPYLFFQINLPKSINVSKMYLNLLCSIAAVLLMSYVIISLDSLYLLE